jgi:hypothetical protein
MKTLPIANDATSQQRNLLSRIAPAVVLICFLLDVSLRFLPPRLIVFRAWESQTLFATVNKPFIPNSVYSNPRSYGDLSNFANLPYLRQYHEEVFSTDSAGYRNPREVAKPFSGILFVGDSFTAGSGVSDAQTLSEQLKGISGCGVYNGAPTLSLWELLKYLQMTRGLVIWQQLGRSALPSSIVPKPNWKRQLVLRVFGNERSEALRRIKKYILDLQSYSPLGIMFGRTVKLLQNDKILPNPYRGEVVDAKLSNGRQILFLPTEVNDCESNRPTDPEFFVELNRQLQKKGIGLLVLLVPDKYDVYHDLLLSASRRTERKPFLDVLEQRLVAANVPVLNLRPRFLEQAKALLAHDEYLYRLDDSHWSAEGIREAAQAIKDSRVVSQCPSR